MFFDSEGKVYSLPAHSFPSARGQGEPLTSRLNPSDGMVFEALAGGGPDEWLLLASDAGYGFISRIQDLYVKNRNGKACVKLSAGSRLLEPRLIGDKTQQLIACVTNIGRLLVFPITELPELTRGKGNKIISIPTAKALAREEWVVDIQLLLPDQLLTVHAGRRHFTLNPADLNAYKGERGRRGNRLPRGLQNVTSLVVQ